EALRAVDGGAVDAVAAASDAPRDEALARHARRLAAQDRWIDYTPAPLARAAEGCISGRGEHSLTWALEFLVNANAHPYTMLHYGDDPDQVGDLRLPSTPAPGRTPLIVLLHGGFWRESYRRDVMAALAVDLARHGIATWNVEYRRVGGSGGGCPRTFEDVARAVDFTAGLCTRHRLREAPPVIVGHSAGGHLALWSAARARLAPGTIGAAPAVTPALVVALAAVSDLSQARRLGIGAGAVAAFLPSPADEAWTDPRALLPLGVAQLLVHGTADESVPWTLAQSYAEAARAARDPVEFLSLPDETHMPLIEPRSAAWRRTFAAMSRHASLSGESP
ncbi:MAG: alpha/beta hydrolase, partial [Gammaproteobacteria bacterium]|nr:alpha/beta hydrolase [Gammaproteobacteria bacterium]